MTFWNSLLGLVLGVLGACVIAAYIPINSRMRRQGARAHWTVGALIAAVGMGSMFCGWALLCLAEPAWRTMWLQIPGGVTCLAGLAIYAVSSRHVGRLRGPVRYTLDLETSGIYCRVRHPQALALCVLAAGLALLSGSLAYLVTLPLWIGFWIAYTYLEERYELIPAFGDQYLRYRLETPRIFPRLSSRKPDMQELRGS